MKKKKPWFLIGISVLIALMLGGIFYMKHQEEVEHQKMVKIATSDAAKQVYEGFIKVRDPKAFTEEGVVQTYEVEKESLEYNPMGGLMVKVLLNGENDIYISFNLIDNGDGTYHSAYFIGSPKLLKYLEGNK